MTKLKEFNHDDQLYYISNFINHCNRICNKFSNGSDEKTTVSAESLLLKQLMQR
tara:strand:+ start:10924 stop:11085 length:162 start_codon:yes stop_codon:yes gene_type:complete